MEKKWGKLKFQVESKHEKKRGISPCRAIRCTKKAKSPVADYLLFR
jgi:hypothetical protein